MRCGKHGSGRRHVMGACVVSVTRIWTLSRGSAAEAMVRGEFVYSLRVLRASHRRRWTAVTMIPRQRACIRVDSQAWQRGAARGSARRRIGDSMPVPIRRGAQACSTVPHVTGRMRIRASARP